MANFVVTAPKLEKLEAPPAWSSADPSLRATHHKRQALAAEFSGKPAPYTKTFVRPAEQPPQIDGPSAKNLMRSVQLSAQGNSAELIAKKRLNLENKVLRFYAFYYEPVAESPIESERVRFVTIEYFAHDHTVMVQAPHIHNSGLKGGTLLKRQRVPIAPEEVEQHAVPPVDGSRFPDTSGVREEFLTINNFNVQKSLFIFGRMYHIYDCDAATREFMESLGIEVAGSLPPPKDKYFTEHRQKMEHGRGNSSGPREGLVTEGRTYASEAIRAARFLRDSGKMLRFYAYWDPREVGQGEEVRHFNVYYFYEDDTIAIAEKYAGRETIAKAFLSRRRIPKSGTTGKSLELTFASRINGQREAYLGTKDSYYEVKDFNIGMTFHVFGRDFLIYDCEDNTRNFYRKELGMELDPPIDVDHLSPKKKLRRLPTPPPTGFGTAEDSKASCRSLVLNPPKKRIPKNQTGETLRFQLKLHTERPEDRMRSFILTYHLDDNEMMISEVALRNTGFNAGKFMRKQRMRKYEGEDESCYYTLEDIKLGATLKISSFVFEVTAVDCNTQAFLSSRETEARSSELAKVSLDRLQQLLTAFQSFVSVRFCTLTEAFRAMDKDHDSMISLSELREVLDENQITNKEPEVVAILGHLDRAGNGAIGYADFFNVLKEPLGVQKHEEFLDVVERSQLCREAGSIYEHNVKRNRILHAFKERLESRYMTVSEMFEMIARMPRAFCGKRAEMASLTNTSKDVCFTPVQLRRFVIETLGMHVTDNELGMLLEFFFPDLPIAEYAATADTTTKYSVKVPLFHAKFVEMSKITELH